MPLADLWLVANELTLTGVCPISLADIEGLRLHLLRFLFTSHVLATRISFMATDACY